MEFLSLEACHCEEHSDEAIQKLATGFRYARNDESLFFSREIHAHDVRPILRRLAERGVVFRRVMFFMALDRAIGLEFETEIHRRIDEIRHRGEWHDQR